MHTINSRHLNQFAGTERYPANQGTVLAAMLAVAMLPSQSGQLVFCCKPDNDLYRSLSSHHFARYDQPEKAVEAAPSGSGLLILADGYPDKTTTIETDVINRAKRKGIKLYVEFPNFPDPLQGFRIVGQKTASWQRVVVASDAFGPSLAKGRILAVSDCRYLPAFKGYLDDAEQVKNPDLVLARVAGYDTAVFGIPKNPPLQLYEDVSRALIGQASIDAQKAFPLLFEQNGIIVATTKLSDFVTGRFAPSSAWTTVWRHILKRLGSDAVPKWTPSVHPTYAKSQKLPADHEAKAAKRGAEWFKRSGVLVGPAQKAQMEAWDKGSVNTTFIRPIPTGGDGTFGILEGYNSQIRHDGEQPQNVARRGDCTGESAFALAISGQTQVAKNLLDYYLFHTVARQGKRADPKHPAYGLVAWGISTYAWEKAFYGDDNARLMLGCIGTAAVQKESKWDEAILMCLLANLRTTGKLGFRDDRIDIENLEANGWKRYFEAENVSFAPHYQAYLWSCYLWAYKRTAYKPFLERAELGIRRTMEAFPAQWTGGFAIAKARMILPLAWLVRVSDTTEHREWLKRVVSDLKWQPCGAASEELGKPGWDGFGPGLTSNEEYGTRETPIVQTTGDPASDQLYTVNFAFLGLHEAAAATGDAYYKKLEDKLADYVCRIQVASKTHPELDGAWFRGFDYDKWEYWASSGDGGWGVWAVETGWTQAWMVAVLQMRVQKTNLWDLSSGTKIGGLMPAVRPRFFGE